eukprot:g3644.t1
MAAAPFPMRRSAALPGAVCDVASAVAAGAARASLVPRQAGRGGGAFPASRRLGASNFVDEVAAELDLRLESLSKCSWTQENAPPAAPLEIEQMNVPGAFQDLRDSMGVLKSSIERITAAAPAAAEKRRKIIEEEEGELEKQRLEFRKVQEEKRARIDEDYMRLRSETMHSDRSPSPATS